MVCSIAVHVHVWYMSPTTMKFPLTVVGASDAHTDANDGTRVFCGDVHIESSKVLADASPNGKDIEQLSVRVGVCVVVLRGRTYIYTDMLHLLRRSSSWWGVAGQHPLGGGVTSVPHWLCQ